MNDAQYVKAPPSAGGESTNALRHCLQLFNLGHAVATPAALALLQANQVSPATLLARHASGDWFDEQLRAAVDVKANHEAITCGGRVLSAYLVQEHRVWVITEADRSSTCILLPEEY